MMLLFPGVVWIVYDALLYLWRSLRGAPVLEADEEWSSSSSGGGSSSSDESDGEGGGRERLKLE
jgi:hypothetical protein